jgi:phage tail sheath protein FI
MPTYLAPGVYVEEVSSGSRPIEGVGTSIAGFAGFAERGPVSEPTLVTNWTQYNRVFGGFVENAYLAHSVYGFFLNGGGSAYILRLPDAETTDGNGEAASFSKALIPSAADETQTSFAVRALTAGPGQSELTVTVTEASQPGDDTFKLEVSRDGKVEESFDNLTAKRGASNVATVLAKRSKLVTLEEGKATTVAPKKGASVRLSGGSLPEPVRVTSDVYVGDTMARTGINSFEAIDEITMVAVPDLMSAYERGLIGAEDVKSVQLAMIAHCELMSDRIAILDSPPGLNAQEIRDWRTDFAGYDSKYATLYYPWVQVMDPVGGSRLMLPPSGHMAGVWARSDQARGVHKAPANEVIRGAVTLQSALTKGEQELLNPIGVNCLRAFPAQGIRVWGARTLSSDPEWRYLNVRRLFNFIEESVLEGTNWVVFEPNDHYLWESVQRVVSAFLQQIWRAGALIGRTPEEAFYVKCDGENNPPESRDEGNLIVEIGVAPVKPAEFVIFRISQFSQGAALEE